MMDQFALMRAVPVVGFLAVLVLACLFALWLDDPHLSRSQTGRRRDAPMWLPGFRPRA